MTESTRAAGGGGAVVESYRLVSIDPTRAPSGSTGDDWLLYRIAQGSNMVTGYRRGSHSNVSAEVERILTALNEPLLPQGRPYRSAGRPTNQSKPPPREDLV